MNTGETIVAVATGHGGALAVIRISGTESISVCQRVFQPVSGKKLGDQPGYTLHYGTITDPATGEIVDDVLLSLFRAPRSYTGEDMVEISCHGSSYIQHEIVRLLIRAGARAAQAGEFTVRAFLNGKIDLSQAEAVADMIASTDRATHALATNQMRGGYSAEFASLRDELVHLVALLELELDFGEEDVTFADRSQLSALLDEIGLRVSGLLSSFTLGNAIKSGIGVAIIGSPNAGKSTLLNALLKEDRAMVSDIAGTTRDVIEETLNIGGVQFRFIDTAGIRSTDDTLEKMGIERTFASVAKARIILLVVDAGDISCYGVEANFVPLVNNIRETLHGLELKEDQKLCIVLNKIDRQAGDTLAKHALLTQSYDSETRPAGTGEISPAPGSSDRTGDFRPASIHSTPDCSSSARLAIKIISSATGYPAIALSAKNGTNLNDLLHFLSNNVETDPLYDGTTIVSNTRHYEALERASEALIRAKSGLQSEIAADLLSQDIREILHHIGTITGEITTDEILGSIFSKFCIGK